VPAARAGIRTKNATATVAFVLTADASDRGTLRAQFGTLAHIANTFTFGMLLDFSIFFAYTWRLYNTFVQ
jgi:hypothetical protein